MLNEETKIIAESLAEMFGLELDEILYNDDALQKLLSAITNLSILRTAYGKKQKNSGELEQVSSEEPTAETDGLGSRIGRH